MTTATKTEGQTFCAAREQELVATLKAEVAKVRDSEDWRTWLAATAKFWSYSFSNRMLVVLQHPAASRVAGFKAWRGLGRTVRRGERAIWILAPIFRYRAGEKPDEKVRFISGFKPVPVFALEQTEGKALPELKWRASGEAGEVLGTLKAVAGQLGFSVSVQDIQGEAEGYVTADKAIVLREGSDTLGHARTLLHELAHGLLGHCKATDLTREQKELQAETAAFMAGQVLGLPAEQASFHYLASWSRTSTDFAEELEKAAGLAATAAKRILETAYGAQAQERLAA